MSNSTKKSPQIRFKGFVDDWEDRKLGNILENLYNGQTPYRLNEDNWNGDINWISSGELNRGVVTKTIEKITIEGQKDANLRIVPKGTFVIAITGLEASGTRGNCAILGIDTTMNQSCMALFPIKEAADSKFLFQWYRKVGEEYGIAYTQGTKQQSYNAEIIKLLPINIPKVEEQNRIAECLFSLDNLITLHQRKLELLKDTKKSMLQKMFPKEGTTVPEIRFPGFTGDWEKHKISEVINTVKRSVKLEDNEIYQLVTVKRRNGGIVSRGFLAGEEILVKNYFEIKEGDFLISKRQIVHGANGCVPKNLNNAVVSNEYMVIVDNESIITKFLALMSRRQEMYRMYFLSSYGVDIEKMVFDVEDWNKRYITIPSIKEQEQISNFFTNIDNLITSQQKELDSLEDFKKSMLQKMFI